MAENDIDYLENNNTNCTIEKNGTHQRAELTVDAQIESTLSFSKNAQVVTSFENDYGVRGNGFPLQKNFTIASAATLFVLIDYTTYSNDDGFIFILPPVFTASAGKVIVNVYRGTDYSGGTEIEVNSNNTIIGNVLETTITHGATGSDKGTSSLEYLVGASSTNQNSGGGISAIGPPFIRNNCCKTLVEIINQSGEEIVFNYSQMFYEI